MAKKIFNKKKPSSQEYSFMAARLSRKEVTKTRPVTFRPYLAAGLALSKLCIIYMQYFSFKHIFFSSQLKFKKIVISSFISAFSNKFLSKRLGREHDITLFTRCL